MLLARGREFTARVSLARLGASCAGLAALAAMASFSPRWIAFAQPPKPAFDVASIKRHKEEGGGLTFAARPGGRLTVVNNEVSNLIQNAYGIANYQLIGAPNASRRPIRDEGSLRDARDARLYLDRREQWRKATYSEPGKLRADRYYETRRTSGAECLRQ